MKLIAIVLTIATAVALPVAFPVIPASAQTQAPLSDIEQALQEAQQLPRFVETLRKSMREPGDRMGDVRKQFPSADADRAWRNAVDSVMAKPALASDIARRQAANLTAEEARTVIAFRRSPLGRKLTQAEATSPFPDDKVADQRYVLAAFQRASRQLDRDKARHKLLSEIFQQAGGGMMQTELLLTMSRGLAVGMATAAAPGQPAPTSGDIDQMVERQRPDFDKLVRAISLPSLALSYGKLSNAELQAYLAWLRSPVGKKNIKGVITAIAALMSGAGTDIGQLFGRELSAQRL